VVRPRQKFGAGLHMADDLINSVLDDGLDDDIPVMLGGQRRLMKSGHLVVDEKKEVVAEDAPVTPSQGSNETSQSVSSTPVVSLSSDSTPSTTAFEIQKVSKPFMPAGKPMTPSSDRTEPVRVSKPTVVPVLPKQTSPIESSPSPAVAVKSIPSLPPSPPPPAPPLKTSKSSTPPITPKSTRSPIVLTKQSGSTSSASKPIRSVVESPLPSIQSKSKSEPKPPLIKEKDPLVQYQEDLKEVKAIVERGLPDGSVEADAVDRIMASLPSDIERVSGYSFVDDAMRKRFVLAAEAFFKDLRGGLETESKFSMSVKSGGLGMTDTQAKNSVKLLVEKRNDFLVAQRSKAEREKRQFVASQVDRQLKEQERQTKIERSELDRRFVELTKQETTVESSKSEIKSEAEPTPNALSTQSTTTRPTGTPKVIRVLSGPASDRKTAGSSEASRRGDAAVAEVFRDLFGDSQKAPEAIKVPPPVNLPLANGETPINTAQSIVVEKTSKPAVVGSKTDKVITQSLSSKTNAGFGSAAPSLRSVVIPVSGMSGSSVAPLPGLQSRQKVSDVVSSTRRLTGPVEELGSLTLQDFRRLSKSPQEATLKIRDKIDILKEESFEVKVAGIKAWRNSAVNRLYLDTLRQSLIGRPVDEVLVETAKSGREALTKPEFDALMRLNHELRF